MKLRRFSQLSDPKILVVRNDGLGDFVLTLPLVASLLRQLPAARVYGLVSHHLRELVPLLPDFAGVLADEGVLLKRHRGLHAPAQVKEKRALLQQQIREHRFDLALLPYSESATAALVHRAGVPLRAGSLRRPYFWRFNLRNPVSRKGSGRAEHELNLTYLRLLGLEETFVSPRLRLPEPGEAAYLEPEPRAYAVLHPHKRSGTALTWPMENFVALAGELLGAGWGVMVVGDAADEPVLHPHFGAVKGARLRTGLSLPQLLQLIAHARLFVGNSSGPLHLAGLAGTPHIGFYPQDQVSAPQRWRTLPFPHGPAHGAGHSAAAKAPADPWRYLLAPQFPKNCVICEGPRCPYFNCVAAISLDSAREAMAAWGLAPQHPAVNDAARATGS